MQPEHMPDNLMKAEAIFSKALDIANDRNQAFDSKVAWGLVILCRALSSEIEDMRTELEALRKKPAS